MALWPLQLNPRLRSGRVNPLAALWLRSFRLKIIKPHHYWFYDHLLLFNFRMVWPVTTDSLREYIEHEFPGQSFDGRITGGKALMIPNETGTETFIAALSEWNGSANCHSVLVHECNHVALMILERRHVEITTSNDECFAYLSSYLVRQCLNVLLPKRLQVEVDPSVKPRNRNRTT
jgi:hypothetical protein